MLSLEMNAFHLLDTTPKAAIMGIFYERLPKACLNFNEAQQSLLMNQFGSLQYRRMMPILSSQLLGPQPLFFQEMGMSTYHPKAAMTEFAH